VKWNDITPRGSAAYNLTGDGKTAVKFAIGKYVVAQDGGGTFGANIVDQNRLAATTVNRAWTDNNHDYVPDCDLLNPLAQSPATTGSIDTCGAYSNSNFGKNVYTNTYDPELIHGWGVRPFDWEMSASIQRELLPKLGVNVGYFRRWYGNFVTTDNRAVGPEDFSQFSITVPTDSRLPDGGGYTVTGFNNVNPAKFGLTDNFITRADKYGKQTEMWQGVDINVVARGYRGLTFSGGTSTGRAVTDDCEVAAKLPETYQGLTTFGVASSSLFPLQWCHLEQAWLTQFKGLGAYLVPKADVLVSATFQSAPLNQHLSANFVASNALVQPSLGRPLSGNAANVTVNILQPGQEYGERSNQLDLRFAKVLRFGGSRTNVGIDLYNALNANPITAYNQTFGARWLVPQTIMPARFLKFSAQVDW
jgi:hypothetical protein